MAETLEETTTVVVGDLVRFQLKVCPFCENPVHFVNQSGKGREDVKGWDIACGTTGCFLQFGAGWANEDLNDLASRWNARGRRVQAVPLWEPLQGDGQVHVSHYDGGLVNLTTRKCSLCGERVPDEIYTKIMHDAEG